MSNIEKGLQLITWLIEQNQAGNVSGYQIIQKTGLGDYTVRQILRGKSKLENIPLGTAVKLEKYATTLREEIIMEEKIKDIIQKFDKGAVDTDDSQDPDYEERVYIDGPKDLYIIHPVEGEKDVELVFAENDWIKEIRQKIYESDDQEEIERLEDEIIQSIYEYADQFNYDKVVGYRTDGPVVWL